MALKQNDSDHKIHFKQARFSVSDNARNHMDLFWCLNQCLQREVVTLGHVSCLGQSFIAWSFLGIDGGTFLSSVFHTTQFRLLLAAYVFACITLATFF